MKREKVRTAPLSLASWEHGSALDEVGQRGRGSN